MCNWYDTIDAGLVVYVACVNLITFTKENWSTKLGAIYNTLKSSQNIDKTF